MGVHRNSSITSLEAKMQEVLNRIQREAMAEIALSVKIRAESIIHTVNTIIAFVPHGPAHTQVNALKDIIFAAEKLEKIADTSWTHILDINRLEEE